MKQEMTLSSPKEETILDSNSRTGSPALAHAGEKTHFLLTKETPFPANPPPGLAVAGTPGPQLALFQLSPGWPSAGVPSPCRGQGRGAGQVTGLLVTL